jgi:L-ribulose-5-phosphate 3-epimerase
MMNRRGFIKSTSIAACGASWIGHAASAVPAAQASAALRKGACIGVLPPAPSLAERFQLARKAGFEGVEPNTLNTSEELQQYKEAAATAGIAITSIMNSDHWKYPLTDNDPEVVKKCMDGIRTSMRNAHELNAGVVLLVPGIVTADVRYIDVYRRSQERIRELLPLAKELGVVIAIENVGNRFLLSPMEFVRYIDEFDSPFLKAYFDVGNIVANGYPQDWIRTIGNRLVRVHIKRFEPGVDHPKFDPADRRTQGINWVDVRKALAEIGYSGWVTAEVRSGDENYLRDLSARMDKFLAGESPT